MNPTTSVIRIYLVDDMTLIRSAMRHLLASQDGFEIVGDQGDARRAVEEIDELRPDVVLMDITMPGLSGLDALAQVKRRTPRTRVVMLTNHESQTFVEQALKAGADGYLSKDSDSSELALAVRSVAEGRTYLSPLVTTGLVTHLREPGTSNGETPSTQLGTLTPREREVFQLLALGRSNKEVARELDISLGTAKKHRENLQRKLDLHSTAELARLAIQEGLL
jgi:DNA-binding NarL/FixJ family response regulator